MGRAPCCTKIGLHRGPWTAREDALLIKYIEAHGEGQWRSLPKKAGLLRCGKSCRLRWMNYLRPDIKRGNITSEEDDLIIRLHALLGNRWSLIAGRLPGRTDNEIKNYWNTHLSKRVRTQGSEPNKASEPGSGKRANGSSSNKKRPTRSSIMNYNNKRAVATQKLHQHKIMDVKDKNVDNVTEKTKTRLPIRPGRVESSMISLTRNSSNRSLETNVSTKSTNTMSTSASSSQSQSQGLNHEVFDPDSIIMDIPWLSHNYNVEENGFDYVMKMGLCGDNNHVNLDIIQPNQDYNRADFSHPQDNNNRQYEKLYEEYLQLIKVDHGHHGLLTGADLDVDDHDDTLDSLTESFLL